MLLYPMGVLAFGVPARAITLSRKAVQMLVLAFGFATCAGSEHTHRVLEHYLQSVAP